MAMNGAVFASRNTFGCSSGGRTRVSTRNASEINTPPRTTPNRNPSERSRALSMLSLMRPAIKWPINESSTTVAMKMEDEAIAVTKSGSLMNSRTKGFRYGMP